MSAFSLPTHPFTGLRALGVLPSGRIVWPVLGGSGEGDGGGSGSGGGDGNGGQGQGQQGEGSGTNDGGKPEDRTFNQADVDRIVADRLRREQGKYADYDQLKSAADELAQIKESQATETEKQLKAAAKDTEAKVRAELEPQMLRLEVALAEGLPKELGERVLSAAKRLVGANRDELVADAKEFFKMSPISATDAGAGDFGQGTRGGNGTAKPTVASGADLYAQRYGKTTA